jgi:Uma2 family endonuclease
MGTTTALMTVDEFLKLPGIEERRVELIQGRVVDQEDEGFLHELVKSNLIHILVIWLSQHRIGRVFAGTSYRVDEHDCLTPDISVLSSDRANGKLQDLLQGAPDLAIEIVSSETAAPLRTKIRLYLKHGSKAVWAVYPDERVIDLHSANGQITKLEQDQILEDNDALPGFSTPVNAIFKGL